MAKRVGDAPSSPLCDLGFCCWPAMLPFRIKRIVKLPLHIESDALSVQIWPHLGGKISSIVDKADGHELMFQLESEVPQHGMYDRSYQDGWYAGWDECFPAVAASGYPRPPYQGVSVPDHGELWGLPTLPVRSRHGIVTVWNGVRFKYRLTRVLIVVGSTLLARYTLTNLSPHEFRFVYAGHALLCMKLPIELQLPEGEPYRHSHGASGVPVDQAFEWPKLYEKNQLRDVSRPETLPGQDAWKLFGLRPSNAATIHYPTRQRSLDIDFTPSPAVNNYWGIWINTGAWNRHRHLAVEPTTGRYDTIEASIADDSAAKVLSHGQVEWTVKWTVRPALPTTTG
jgi:hypothetical protein